MTLSGVRLVSVQLYADFLNKDFFTKNGETRIWGVLRVAGQLTERLQLAVIKAILYCWN